MDRDWLVRAGAQGVAAAVIGGLVGTALTRGLMRLVILAAGGSPQFSWTGTAFIGLFYVVFLLPGAIAVAWSRARRARFVLGAGALAIAVQAAGIATTDLESVGPFSTGQWAVLVPLFVAMAAAYAVQAGIVYRVARGARPAVAAPAGA